MKSPLPEALTEGETEEEARINAVDCVIAALDGYLKGSKALPRQGASQTGRGPSRPFLPS